MLHKDTASLFNKIAIQIAAELHHHKDIEERLHIIRDLLKPVYTDEDKKYLFNQIKNYRYIPRTVEKANIQLVLDEIQNWQI